jgi:spore coat protein U-like protein
MKSPALSVFALCAALLPAIAQAGGCTVSSNGLAFGRYEPLTFESKLLSLPVTSDATVSVSCTGIVTGGGYTITLGPSMTGAGDRISTRYMNNAVANADMAFNVYVDAARTLVWGDGITAGSTLAGSISPGNSNLSHSVYGRIPAGQNTLAPGSYSSTLTMTITYSP